MGFDLIPAIDLRGGRCVRLLQGDYAHETVYSEHPAATAAGWTEAGAKILHVVDLDGAASGRPVNLEALRAIRRSTAATIEYGGGLRDDEAIRAALDAGADRIVLGTALINHPQWVEQLCAEMAERVVVGIDARDGRVATDGWQVTSSVTTEELVERANGLGVQWGLFTDIQRDGTLAGPNLEALQAVARRASFGVLASGGMSSIADLEAARDAGAAGAIIGRALYTGQIDLHDAVARFE
jgi:phosphoribosylformimino-5-aminoimidazole carboxamide ribotide isomerase